MRKNGEKMEGNRGKIEVLKKKIGKNWGKSGKNDHPARDYPI